MDIVLRAAAIYFVVWLIMRLADKRTLADMTAFDFVLLLIISETTQAGLMGRNNSVTSSVLLIVTMVGLDIALSLWKQKSRAVEKFLDGTPLVILADGIPIRDRLQLSRVDEGDILAAARMQQGLERLEQIKFAVLERNGGISVIPRERAAPGR